MDWFGIGMVTVGLVLLLNLRGAARGVAELSRALGGDYRATWLVGTMPRTTWGIRLVGALLVVFGVCIAVFPDPS